MLPKLFSLRLGKSPEIDSSTLSNIKRHLAIGTVRTHIRVPGGTFAVALYAEDDDGTVVYGAVNAGPNEANGQIAVRWKAPGPGRYRAVLWKQKDKTSTKVFGSAEFTKFVKTNCTKVTEFMFFLVD